MAGLRYSSGIPYPSPKSPALKAARLKPFGFRWRYTSQLYLSALPTFLDYLSDSVSEAQKYLPDLITSVGDWNAGNCWLPPNSSHHSPVTSFDVNLKNTTETLGLAQLINSATRIQGNTRDLAFVDTPALIKAFEVAPTFWNIDHLPLLFTLSFQANSTNQDLISRKWDYRNSDIGGLTTALSEIDWDGIVNKDTDEAVGLLVSSILNIAERHIPTKTVRIGNDKPWFSAELRKEMRKRDTDFSDRLNEGTMNKTGSGGAASEIW